MIPLTRSIVQGIRSAAMNFAKSLDVAVSSIWWINGLLCYRSRKSTDTPKSVAILLSPTTL